MFNTQGSRIVGFEVVPFSIKHAYEDAVFDPTKTLLKTCNEMTPADNNMETLQVRNDFAIHFLVQVLTMPENHEHY